MDYRKKLRKRKASENVAMEWQLDCFQPKVVLERCDAEKAMEIIEIDENEVDTSVEFVREEKASSEIIQIARSNKRIANLERALKEKNHSSTQAKSCQSNTSQNAYAGPSQAVNNCTDQSNHGEGVANNELADISLSDSFIARLTKDWDAESNVDGILSYLDPENQ